ncbi:dicarboxylate/amino acid:cation symporter [Sansalvadorimonas verongulae]|uniref:dicarboxylate/amino acid:cation symporter n=1 Tax=Sansalvadorimonas verongulae TaxID=2172824 RepID=UPI002E2F3301|nr:dicarboxylate/amino acid:cation symporter [Sansalvadorimonas verongulae]MTI14460.1 dicarboxylate/amino acid:cation symporter [Sansalvadorimonas verongulae]
MKLIIRLVLGIVAGVLIGLFLPEVVTKALVTFKGVFGEFLNFTVPLIILFYVMSGIGSMQKGSGRMLGLTLFFSYASTIAAGVLAFLVAREVLPVLVNTSAENVTQGAIITPWISIDLPPILSVATALVTAFMFGMGVSVTRSRELLELMDHARDIVELVLLKVILPGLPLYICSVFAEMGASGTVFSTLSTFAWVLGMAIILHWVWLLILFSIVGAGTGRNPLNMMKIMMPSYITAVGTLSSAAAIPVTVDCARKLRLNAHVVDFAIPLCATIHLSGSAITLTVCASAVMLMSATGLVSIGVFFPFLMTLGVTLVAAPGIPGGAVMASIGLLVSMLGFDDSAVALMIALYLAQDSFGTACNVTGDGAIATIVDYIGADRWEHAEGDSRHRHTENQSQG